MPDAVAPGTPAVGAVTRTFLFSDLRGYTAFVERHGDAAAAELLAAYRAIVRAEVARHQGAEIKTEGDSFYVAFVSAAGALDCAVGVLRAVALHNAAIGATPLEVGIGLHAGETVAFDAQFVGSAVNVASRLAGQAGTGEIVISDTLRGLVRTARGYPLTDRGSLELKGVSEPIRAWTVEWREGATAPTAALPLLTSGSRPRPATPEGQLVCPVLIGRDDELERFAALLEAALAGRGQAAILGGEAGVGKTAFVREAIDRAAARGFRLLYGATVESDAGLPYAPFLAAVRSGFRGVERERLGRVLAQAAPGLAQLFPEIGTTARAAPSAREEQHRVAVAFQGLFYTFAREAPILVVVEDLHWADAASLELLHYLARELGEERVLLLGTYRTDEMHRKHPFLRALATMERERLVSEIVLDRLDRERTGALIQATFGMQRAVTEDFLDAVHGRAEGNPFFTEEILKSLVESGDIYRDETGWTRKHLGAAQRLRLPGSVREAIRARVEPLAPEAQGSLSAAAAIGQRFSFELLQEVTATAAPDLLAHLRQFIELQLVLEATTGEDDYAFRHALTREVVYEDLLVPERMQLHRRIAAVLASRSGIPPSVLAQHLIAAGDTSAAVPHLLAAAAQASAAYAPREAAAHYDTALELGVPADELPRVLERLAEATYLFDLERSARIAERAAALYEERDDRLGASRALWIASRSLSLRTRVSPQAGRARALAERVLAVLDGTGETVELARALANLAYVAFNEEGDAARCAELAGRAIDLGRRLGDTFATSHGLVNQAMSLMFADPVAALRGLIEARDVALEHGHAEVVWRAYANLTLSHVFAERPAQELADLLDQGVAYARSRGIERAGSGIDLGLERAVVSYDMGDWDDALARAAARRNAPLLLARIALGRDGPEAAARILSEAWDAEPELAWPSRFRRAVAIGSAYALLGDAARSREWLDRVPIDESAPIAKSIHSWSFDFALAAVLLLDDRSWPERAAGWASANLGEPARGRFLAHYDAIRALIEGDVTRCAELLLALRSEVRRASASWCLGPVAMCALDARRRGLGLGPEWHPLLDDARVMAERSGARWWSARLAEVSAG